MLWISLVTADGSQSSESKLVFLSPTDWTQKGAMMKRVYGIFKYYRENLITEILDNCSLSYYYVLVV